MKLKLFACRYTWKKGAAQTDNFFTDTFVRKNIVYGYAGL